MAFSSNARSHRSTFTYAVITSVLSAAIFVLPSQARDRDAEQQMKELARQQRQDERQRQREEERQAREQEKRAKEMQAEMERKAAQERAAIGKTDSFASGTSNTKTNAASNGNNAPVNNAASSSSKSDSNNKSNATPTTSKAVVTTPSEPPKTVAKWLEQLTAPKVETPAAAPASEKVKSVAPEFQSPKSAIAPPVVTPSTNAAGKSVGKVGSGKAGYGGTPEPITFLDVPLPEVLAVNATAETIARVKSLGFTAAPATSLASLNLSVTRLLPPRGMSPNDAQMLLEAQVPSGSFAPNKKYRIYKTAAGGPSAKPSGVPLSPSGETQQTCSGDRCFAQNIIGWTPELRRCASGLKVGIIDTAVDISHPTFRRKQIEVRHFGPKDRPGPDWHGTGVAALLAGDDKSATPGLIPDASFYVADIFYAGEDKGPASDTVSMLRAFNWLESSGVKIINMSLSGPPDTLIEDAVAKLAAKGIWLVAAAGNEGPNNAGPSYPAAYDDVIAVTAVNKNLQNYRYANRGAYVDVAAHGVAISTALPGSKNG